MRNLLGRRRSRRIAQQDAFQATHRRAALAEPLEARLVLSAGTLDTSFGSGGELAVQFPNGQSISIVRDSLVQPDGKIVIAGEANDPNDPGSSDFALARLNQDGSPDLSFNGTGIVIYNSPGDVDQASGVALQSDGKIVVSATFGETRPTQSNYGLFAIGRFNADGTVDTNFGDEGAVVVDFTVVPSDTQVGDAADVLVGPDDKITAIGYAQPDPNDVLVTLALARLNADGTLDQSFGVGGQVLATIFQDAEFGFSGAFDSAGNIIVTGTALTPGDVTTHFITVRFLPNGDVDTSFGTFGAVTTDFALPGDGATLAASLAAAVQPDGKIVVGGLVAHADTAGNPTSLHVALARYNADGSIDFGFGDGGQVESDLGQFTSINKLLIDADGRIIGSGLSATTLDALNNKQFNPFVVQYTPDGDLDRTFGNNGAVFIDVQGIAATRSASALSADSSARFLRAAAAMMGADPIMMPAAAGDTQSQQAVAVFRKQSAIVVALGDKLLVLTSAGERLTAAQLIGNGADLVAGTVTGIKAASVIGGAKGAAAVKITNTGNEPLTGTVTIRLLISTDGTADGADAVASTTTSRLSLKMSRAKSVKLKFVFPSDLPDGSYFVLADIDGGVADVNATNDTGATAAPITIAKPFIDITGTLTAPATLPPAKKIKLPLTLQNLGNIAAKGTVHATIYASTDNTFDTADRQLASPLTLKASLKANGSKGNKLTILTPTDLAAGTYFLIAVLDATTFTESTTANNAIVSGTTSLVSA